MPFSLTDVIEHRLPNGLTVIAHLDRTTPIVTSLMWYRVGSADERPGLTGISHFIEHMLFKGTRRFGKGQIDFLTAANGGYNNAFTSHDYTAYYFGFASDRWELAMEIEADRMRNGTFDEEEVELERQVILEEIRMERDSPWEALRQAADSWALTGRSNGRPVIGSAEDVAAMTRRDLLQHYRTHYRPTEALLVLAGDLDPDRVIPRVEALFGRMKAKGAVRPSRPSPDQPRRTLDGKLEVPRPERVGKVLTALPFPSACDEDFPVLEVADRVLSEGRLSRLYRRLVETEAVASSVDSDYAETAAPYHLILRAELAEGASPEIASNLILEELARMADSRVTEEELKRARRQALMHSLTSLETTFDQAFQLGLWASLGDWRRLNQRVERLECVGRDDLLRVARKYLSPDQAVTALLIPSV